MEARAEDIVWVYATASSQSEALEIARAVVRERLAACANLLPGVTSIYEWRGEYAEESEVVLISKTSAALASQLVARIVELHSYEVPCVVCLPLLSGHEPFLEWVRGQVGGQLDDAG